MCAGATSNSLSHKLKHFSLSIKLYSCTHILSVLPIAQLVELQTVVLKVVSSNLAWQM